MTVAWSVGLSWLMMASAHRVESETGDGEKKWA